MASGIPVVATSVGGTPELLVDGETGLLIEKENPKQIAECILRLVRNKKLRRKMGEAGMMRTQRMFDIRKTACQIEGVILNA
jgi:glycosyltransferase involved in cell wall biosynthesis